MNEITVHGNATADPELRRSRSGVPVATFTVAANHRRRSRAGEWADLPPFFHRVVCFNALAENVAATVHRGTTVAVTGEFADDSYTREDGSRVRRTQIEAGDVAISLRYATAQVTRTCRTDNGNPARAAASDPGEPAEEDKPVEPGRTWCAGAKLRDHRVQTFRCADQARALTVLVGPRIHLPRVLGSAPGTGAA